MDEALIVTYSATQAETKIASTTARPGEPLAADAAEVERDPERHRGERVAEVVDQVGEQRDRAGEREDRELRAPPRPRG